MALRGADLTLAAGERLLVAGPNGSGKSTLLRVVTGDQPVLAGRVEVGGAAVHAMDDADRRRWRTRALGFVDQHARRNLLPELDVRDNVALQLRLTGTRPAVARARAEETLERLGLGALARADVRRLSGGEAQRVALCAAVAHGPALVLADEPTGELDEDAARQVYGLLESVAADGTGVILVSHDPRSDAFVDRAVRLRDGRLAEEWVPGRAGVAQVADSRGWVRVPSGCSPPTRGVRRAGRRDRTPTGSCSDPRRRVPPSPRAWSRRPCHPRATRSRRRRRPRRPWSGSGRGGATARCSPTSTWTCPAARGPRCGARPAAGSRRCSAWSPG